MLDVGCDHRRAITDADSCIEFRSVQLSCPAGNTESFKTVDLEKGAYPRLRCRVCGIEHLPADSDPAEGAWTGQVSWGPNQFDGQLSESEIASYSLFIVDAQFQKLLRVATQEVRLWATLQATCCDMSTYKVQVATLLPPNATYFMVVPTTTAGTELNVGPISERIIDSNPVRPAMSGSSRPLGGLRGAWVPLLAACAMAALLQHGA